MTRMETTCNECRNGHFDKCIGFMLVPDREHDTRTSLRQPAPYKRAICVTRERRDAMIAERQAELRTDGR